MMPQDLPRRTSLIISRDFCHEIVGFLERANLEVFIFVPNNGGIGDEILVQVSFANCDSYAYNITKHDKHVN